MQDPLTLGLMCDVCEHEIPPKEKFVHLPVMTVWAGPVGQGVSICKACAERMFEINTPVLEKEDVADA